MRTLHIPIDELTPEQMRAELTLLRAAASYECCCIIATNCDCYTKRDTAWRSIPGNYACPNCCNDDCTGTDCKGCEVDEDGICLNYGGCWEQDLEA